MREKTYASVAHSTRTSSENTSGEVAVVEAALPLRSGGSAAAEGEFEPNNSPAASLIPPTVAEKSTPESQTYRDLIQEVARNERPLHELSGMDAAEGAAIAPAAEVVELDIAGVPDNLASLVWEAVQPTESPVDEHGGDLAVEGGFDALNPTTAVPGAKCAVGASEIHRPDLRQCQGRLQMQSKESTQGRVGNQCEPRTGGWSMNSPRTPELMYRRSLIAEDAESSGDEFIIPTRTARRVIKPSSVPLNVGCKIFPAWFEKAESSNQFELSTDDEIVPDLSREEFALQDAIWRSLRDTKSAENHSGITAKERSDGFAQYLRTAKMKGSAGTSKCSRGLCRKLQRAAGSDARSARF